MSRLYCSTSCHQLSCHLVFSLSYYLHLDLDLRLISLWRFTLQSLLRLLLPRYQATVPSCSGLWPRSPSVAQIPHLDTAPSLLTCLQNKVNEIVVAHSMLDPSSPTRDQTHSLYIGRQILNHLTIRKVPHVQVFVDICFCLSKYQTIYYFINSEIIIINLMYFWFFRKLLKIAFQDDCTI